MPSRPNILLVMTDQQRADTIGALGNPQIRTPALDRLVREGTAFANAYTPSPVCISARSCLATGLGTHAIGVTDNTGRVVPDASLMERLAATGYQCHGVGKMHFVPTLRPWGFHSRDVSEEIIDPKDCHYRRFLAANGFGHVLEPHGSRSEHYYVPQVSQLPAHLHETAWVADRSIDFLARRDRSAPFFLWTSFIKPHPPFENPVPWYKLYRAAEMPLPFMPADADDLVSWWGRRQNQYKFPDIARTPQLARLMRAAYYGCISFMDQQLGRLLAALGDDLDDTLVLFVADHGDHLGDYGHLGKRSMLSPSVRIPCLARLPGRFAADRRCATPVSLLDILPTCLSAAGAEAPRVSADGRDLAAIAAAGDDGGRVVFSQFQHGAYGLHMATTRDWRYIWSAADDREWLFDLRMGPESIDRAQNPLCRAVRDQLRACLVQRYRRDGYEQGLDGDGWRRYGRKPLPGGRDAGIIFQEPDEFAAAITALGPYARPQTVAPFDLIPAHEACAVASHPAGPDQPEIRCDATCMPAA